MPKLKIFMTSEFERELSEYMDLRGIQSKSEAVRMAVRESLLCTKAALESDFESWIGSALGPGENPHPRFRSLAELWS